MITFARLFKPTVALTLATQPIAALRVPGVAAPRIVFRVKRTMASSPDTATVSVYGLDVVRRGAIQSVWSSLGRAPLTIAAGYDGVTLPLFAGDVRSLSSTLEGADYVTTAIADDGGDTLTDAAIPAALASTAGVDAATMITIALSCFNSPAAYVPPAGPPLIPITAHPSVAAAIATMNPAATTLFYTAVSVGKARDLLDEAARIIGARWWIRDSQLYMAKRQAPIDGLMIQLPRTHWLTEPSEDAAGTVRVATFLDPNIVPGRQIQLIGRVAPGLLEPMRVEAAEYTGDNESTAPQRVDLVMRRIG